MSIVPRTAARGPSLRDLIEVCRELGITPDDVRDVARQVGGNVMETAIHLGHNVYDAFQDLLHQHRERLYNERQDALENDVATANSLSNSPAIQEAEPAQEMSNKRARVGPQGAPVVGDGNEDDGGVPNQETTLDPIKHIWHRFPNSQTARLKWVYTQMMGFGTENLQYRPSGSAWDQQAKRDITTSNTYIGGQSSLEAGSPVTWDMKTPKLIKYRMTSPYSIVASDIGNLSEPQWIGYFESLYQYYHCIKCHWQLSFSIAAAGTTSNTTNPNYRFYVYWKYANYDDPPTQFTVDLTGKTTYDSTTQNLTPDDYDRMGGWNKICIMQNSTHDVVRVISGTYNHGDCGMDIKMMGVDGGVGHGASAATAEGWVSTGVIAPFPENLCVVIVNDNSNVSVSGIGINIGLRSEIDYTLQFKDLKPKFKYPTQSQTIGGTYDIGQYFFRGAAQLTGGSAAASAGVGTFN